MLITLWWWWIVLFVMNVIIFPFMFLDFLTIYADRGDRFNQAGMYCQDYIAESVEAAFSIPTDYSRTTTEEKKDGIVKASYV